MNCVSSFPYVPTLFRPVNVAWVRAAHSLAPQKHGRLQLLSRSQQTRRISVQVSPILYNITITVALRAWHPAIMRCSAFCACSRCMPEHGR
jgi:hypothetical protein